MNRKCCIPLASVLAFSSIPNPPSLAQHRDRTRSRPSGGIFISGHVARPNGYAYAHGMTLMKALGRAGGFTKGADAERVKILRGAFYHARKAKEHVVNVKRIKQGKAKDVLLNPGDWVRVDKRPARWNIGRLFPPRSVQRGVERAFREYADELAIAVGVILVARAIQVERDRRKRREEKRRREQQIAASGQTESRPASSPLPAKGSVCAACTGYGGIFCFTCRGTGTAEYSSFGGSRTIGEDTPGIKFWKPRKPCAPCGGKGKLVCPSCGGTGRQK